jgi:hypothetical protein
MRHGLCATLARKCERYTYITICLWLMITHCTVATQEKEEHKILLDVRVKRGNLLLRFICDS